MTSPQTPLLQKERGFSKLPASIENLSSLSLLRRGTEGEVVKKISPTGALLKCNEYWNIFLCKNRTK